MSSIRVEGGKKLHGRIKISGSKNSCLALMAGAALGREDVVLTKAPANTDVQIMAALLREIGVQVEEKTPGVIVINGAKLRNTLIPHELARKLRASFYLSGLFLARLGKAEVPLPGGCFLGPRPVDFHIKGFQALGARVAIEHGLMKAILPRPTGNRIFINRRSMGTTINLMLLAVLAEGTTILENAAREPEIVDLAVLLNSM
ncbi:MAG: UDP-N-acetylglucosamine 1-carboxyvinyltransferase, partial [Clostridia bacterium]|nr:UDP-N-acetylglucosamine 1-carboxyvinyltransferase [Clostridia bacterium]